MTRSSTPTVHACPPTGTRFTPCCGRLPSELPTPDPISTDPDDVTCTDAAVAGLVVDSDHGESPFGWREAPAPVRASVLTELLITLRRQVAHWARPAPAATIDGRAQDHAVAMAAGLLLAIIDHNAPGIDPDDGNPEEVLQRPALTDRFAVILTGTPRGDCTDFPPSTPHTLHNYDARCALCTTDVNALAHALAAGLTSTPLPPPSALT